MGERPGRQVLAIFMLVLFAISTQSYYFSSSDSSLHPYESVTSNTLGQEEKIAIGSYPDGAVEKVKISVPDGQVVQSMNIDLESADLATSTAYSFSESIDFDTKGASIKIEKPDWIKNN